MSDTAIDVGFPQVPRTVGTGTARVLRVVAPLLVAAVLIGVWELWTKVGNVSHFLLPTPTAVFSNMVHETDIIFPAAWITIKETLEGFTIAALSGVGLAVAIAAFKPIRLTIYPILVGSQVIPKIAIAPVILILFGLGHTSRIIIIVSLTFFPIVISTVVGLQSVEPTKIHLARSLGAGGIKTFLKIRIPQSLPDMFGGLKLAATRAVGGALVSEYITPGPGLGRVILLASSELHPQLSLACIGYLIMIGLALFFVVTSAERFLTPWAASSRNASH